MAVKIFNTRVKNKIDKFSSLSSFKPLKGEIVIGGQAVSSNLGENTKDNPYIAKIGDGTNFWNDLPSMSQLPLKGYTGSQIQSLGAGNYKMNVSFTSDERKYVFEQINSQSTVSTISVQLNGIPYLGEHYILLKNVGNSDVWFGGLTADFGNNVTVNINTRQDYIVAGDICEIQIKVFKIGNEYYVTAIPQLGINQSITSSNGENTWYVNRI